MESKTEQVKYIYYGREKLEISHQKIAAVTGAAQTLIAAQTGKIIVVLCGVLTFDASDTLVFLSNATALTGAIDLATGIPLPLSFNPMGWLKTASGEALKGTIGGGNNLNGWLEYIAATA